MKKLLFLSAILGVLFIGCATDPYYNAGKTVYLAGKKVVIANWDKLPPETQEKLKKLDTVAKEYDSARKVIKPAIETAKKQMLQDANSTTTNKK